MNTKYRLNVKYELVSPAYRSKRKCMEINPLKSIYKKVGIASLIMTASIFLSRIIGLIREMVIAYISGTGASVDAYQVAFVIPDILNHILATGFLAITFIPIFTGYLAQKNETEGWRVFSLILTVFGSLLAVLVIITTLFAPQMMSIVGFENPATRDIAIRMTRIIMPAQFFFFCGGLLTAVQYAKEKFLIPALAPLIYNIGIISGGLVLGPWIGIEGFAWGVLAGAIVGNFLLQIIGARQVGMVYRPEFSLSHPDLVKYLLLTLPLMIGLTMTFSTEFFFRIFGSYLPEGSVSSLNYSLRLMFVLVGLFGQAAGVATYPFMARLVSENRIHEMNRLMNRTLRYIALAIPVSVSVMVLRKEVIHMVFQRGTFDAAATDITSKVLIYIMIGTFAFAAQTMVSRGYYAMQNTIFPALFGSLAVLLSIPLYIIGMEKMGVSGVALAISVSAIFQVTLLYVLWNRKSRNREALTVYRFFAGMIALSIPLSALLEWLRLQLTGLVNTGTFWGSASVSAIIGAAFLFIFLLSGYIFGIDEIKGIANGIRSRLIPSGSSPDDRR